MKKPNVLLLLADDMRYDAVHALGDPNVITPNLDALAARGTTMCRTFIPGGTVAAVCMPSRAMLHTGRDLWHLCEDGKSIPADHALLGETLRQNGYRCFGTGKWHNGTESFARSFDCGAEIFFGGMYDHWKVPLYHFDPTGKYDQLRWDVMNPGLENTAALRPYDHTSMGIHSSQCFADAACDFLRTCDGDQPFFLYLGFMAPHDPRTMPQKYRDMYDPEKLTLPPNIWPQHPFPFGVEGIRDELLAAYPRDEAEIRRHLRDYYAMITHLDDCVGQVLGTLREQGLEEDTVVIFASDNGLSVGQHGLMGKQSCYEHSIRVPLIAAGPKMNRDYVSRSPAYLFDLFPTVCELCGIPVPDSVLGQSFAGCLLWEGAPHRGRIYAQYGDKVRSLEDGRCKLIRYKIGKEYRDQFFNLSEDPWETRDLSEVPGYWEYRFDMGACLQEFALGFGDPDTPQGKRFWDKTISVEPDGRGD